MLFFLGLVVSSCAGSFWWKTSAPPLVGAVELVEADDAVAGALGAPVSVSLAVSRRMDRDWLRALRTGDDVVDVVTWVSGSQGEADLVLHAENHDDQGWAGTFSLTLRGRRVLTDGGYVNEGARVLLAGDFAPDGRPRVGAR